VHCELMVPGLLATEARLPALELLLARSRASHSDPEDSLSWLGRAFGVEPLPAGALTAGEPGYWLRADPVYLNASRGGVVMLPLRGLKAEHAAALVDTLNRHFAGRHEFRAPHPDAWAMTAAPAPIDAAATAQAAGRDLADVMPAAPWPALLTEIQMTLHQHPANEGQDMEVNGVWLWGGGELPAAVEAPWRSVSADEPLALGLARAAGLSRRAIPASAGDWLEQLPEDGRHLVAFDGMREDLEARWFAPLLAALKAGRIGMLTLHAPEAGLSFEITRAELRHFWRRPHPVAQHAPR
jgi:hypothetical protein